MTNWRLIYTPPSNGAWNMAVDESILEHIGRGESIPTLRLYAWNPPCLSLGHAQPFSDVDMNRLKQRGWEVVRRATGGRAFLARAIHQRRRDGLEHPAGRNRIGAAIEH